MKNSLFKRAFAAAAAVPLALTQCLGVANAVYVDTVSVPAAVKNAAANTTVTLDDGSESAILYIAPGKNEADATDGYIRQGETFVKDSSWNSRAADILEQVAAGSNRTGVIDMSDLFNQAVEKSGQFKELTKSLTEKLGDITYAVADNGDITIKASLDDIAPIFTADGSNTIGGALKDIAAEYGIEDLDTPDNFFEDVVIAGDFEAVIYSSSLRDGTSLSGYVKFTDKATGKVYEGTGIIDWALEQFDSLKVAAEDACEKYEEYGVDMDDAVKQINDSVSFYVKKLETAKKYADKALTYEKGPVDASNVSVIIERAKNWLAKKNINKKIPGSTAAEIASSKAVQDVYNNLLGQLNGIIQPNVVDITAVELGEFADTVYDITASTLNGKATFTAKFEDTEAEAAMAYIKDTYSVQPTKSYKEVTINVDFSTIKSGTSSADVQIQRIVEVEPLVTTSTTSTTTTSTTTTSTTNTNLSTTTSTTDTNLSTTTSSTVVSANTTTSSTVVSADTTTSSTVVSADTTTSSTVVSANTTTSSTDAGSNGTTTSSTDAGSNGTTTSSTDAGSNGTTTSSTATNDPTVTTTKVVRGYFVNYTVESDYGFYLNMDREFNKDQIASIAYSVDYSDVYYDADDNVLGESIIIPGEKVDIKDVVEFKDTPSDIFETTKNILHFSHQIPVYAADDIVADDGTIVAFAGDVLKNVDGSNISVTAYVGVKGDATLDNVATSDDASATLTYYSKISTGGKPADTVFSKEAVEMGDPILDDFALFLCDVDNENDSQNFNKLKPARLITADDASIILTAYSKFSTGLTPNRDTWNDILGVAAKVD